MSDPSALEALVGHAVAVYGNKDIVVGSDVVHGSAQEPATEGFSAVALSESTTASLVAHCLSHKCARGSG